MEKAAKATGSVKLEQGSPAPAVSDNYLPPIPSTITTDEEKGLWEKVCDWAAESYERATKDGVDPEKCAKLKDAKERCDCLKGEAKDAEDRRVQNERKLELHEREMVKWQNMLEGSPPGQTSYYRKLRDEAIEEHKKTGKNQRTNSDKIRRIEELQRETTTKDINALHGVGKQGWDVYATAVHRFGLSRYAGAKEINVANRVRHHDVLADYAQVTKKISAINASLPHDPNKVQAFDVKSGAALFGNEPRALA